MLNPTMFRTAVRKSRCLRILRRTSCITSSWDTFPRKAASGSPRRIPRPSRAIEKTRSSWGASRTYALPSFTDPMNPPPAVASTSRTPETVRTSSSMLRRISSMRARLVPCGALTVTLNSPSSAFAGR
jgi:hypothetical protein